MGVGDMKKIQFSSLSSIHNRDTLTNRNRIDILNNKKIMWKKINISVTVHFCLGK